MPSELVSMSDQFKGLPMGELIGGPLSAACDAQVRLAQATANFIKVVGFLPPSAEDAKKDPNAVGGTREALFRFKRPVDGQKPGEIKEEEVELCVPLLSIVKVPSLSITKVDITFDMEVKSSFSSKEGTDASASVEANVGFDFGAVNGSVTITGSVSTHQENTRSSDNSAKYHVAVHAEDSGMPEGLAKVLDILQTAAAPRRISKPQEVKPLPSAVKSEPVTV